MSRALAWIRKSKGSEDDVGLEEQRRKVPAVADELADDVERLDLGVQSGFSTMTRDDDEGLLDQNEDVLDVLDDIRDGRYDYVVAIDDRRICRDEYLSVIQYACQQGECSIEYVDDVDEDDLTFDLKRRIERDTKEEEIRKSREAIAAKKRRGDDLGRPRFGMTYNEAKTKQVPGERFEDVIEAIQMNNRGRTYEEISDELEIPIATISRIMNRTEWYIEREKYAET